MHFKRQQGNIQQGQQTQGGFKRTLPTEGKPRETIQCWGCGGSHMRRDCPHQKDNSKRLNNIGESITVEDMARETPRIYSALDDHQADHQATVVEIGGKIAMQSISILIDPGSSHSYIHPKIVETCSLNKSKHGKPWLVQLATGTKMKVN